MHNSIEEFIDYIYSFYYVVDCIYPVYGCTKTKIVDAIHENWRRLQEDTSTMTWGYGDSLDRERVRDIMFEMFPSISYAKTNS